MSNLPLPKLVRYDLNADGSVTLLLEHADDGDLNIIRFAAGETADVYRVTKIISTLACDGEPESLGLVLLHVDTGIVWKLVAQTDNVLSTNGAILSHLKAHRPKSNAAVLPYLLQSAALYMGQAA